MGSAIHSSLMNVASRLRESKLPAGVVQPRRPGTVQRILRAAEENFAAGVNKALLYYYFSSKEELYRFTLTTLFRQLRAQTSAALDRPGTPRQRLLRYINSYFDFMMAHPNYPRLFERELMSQEPRLAGLVQEHLRPLHRRITSVIRAGIAEGEFRRVNPQHTLFSLVAMTVFYFAAAPVLTQLWHHDPLAPRRVAVRRRAILDFVEHALFLPGARKR